MKKACLKLLLLFMLLGGGMEAYAQATLSMDDVKLKLGETAEISIDMSNSVDIQIASFQISLSDGLVLVPAYYDEDIEEYRVMQFAPERKPKRGQLEENLISDNTINVLAYSSADGGIFKGSEGAILYFTVKALENTAPGTYSITLTGSDKLVSPDEVGYNQEDVTADVTVYQVVEVKVSSEGHGSVSGGGEYETGTEITLTATPDEGYHFVEWSDGSTENPYTFVVSGAAELIALFEANKYEVVFTIDDEVVKKDSVAYGAAITVPEAPAKEGHTFTGWGEIPASMPAKDLAFTGTYTVNKYAVVYKVDGKVYKTDSIAYNAPVTVEPAPVKEGHTFSGWSEVPSLMPAKDVEVTGSFTVNKYEVVFTIDGEVVEKDSVAYGAAIPVPEAPAKEGHTFAGWGEIPVSMPAKDLAFTGTYTVNRYAVVYKVDGKVYKTDSIAYNAPITVEPAPVKEGHTFCGWSEVPSVMPAKDVEVTGSFTVNRYEVVFTIDGEVVEKDSVAYGAAIPVPEAPAKEGHTFAGWGEIPASMPAKDLAFTGTYTVNRYAVVYKVDGKLYKTDSVEYNAPITVEPAPVKEGHTFSGWSEVPSLMPAKDVEVTGSFTVNKYEIVFIFDGEVVEKDSVAYGSVLVAPDVEEKEGHSVTWDKLPKTMPANDLTINGRYIANVYILVYKVDGVVYKTYNVTYNAPITVKPAPVKEGHTFSGWSEVPSLMPAKDVEVTGSFTVNQYNVTFVVDEEVIAEYVVNYGETISLPETPAKEGHTFSGWDGVPETMPAKDLTISGTFVINKYLVTFKIGDEVIASYSLEYGAAIVIPEAPEKEGHTFNGWGEVAETVPAGDVTYEGTYTVNIYKVYYYVGEELVHTAEVAYGEAIPEYVYEPAEEGYTFLGWVGETYATMPAHDVTYTANIDDAIEHLTIDNGELTIYDLAGRKVTDTENLRSGIYIINGRKVIVK